MVLLPLLMLWSQVRVIMASQSVTDRGSDVIYGR